jgi:ATP-dependent RNA helicase DDX10/DBP4
MNAADIATADEEEGTNGGEKKRKLSPLERLKEKIKQKKLQKSKADEENCGADNGWDEMEGDLAEALGEKKKKISKFERRERRLDELRAVPMNEQDDDDEALFTVKDHIDKKVVEVQTPKYTQAELKALSALKKQKLRLRSDGTFNVRGAGGLGAGPEKIVFRDEDQ